ncbi:hypothetical protein ANN_09684 [Periplaneta americana]|uniref:Uncharacterized protein n=1 Tax=Periplaneta americana TaxID=6978 RepID=A0ABQ8TPM0_PERAM|nr:hypothetical protein ANN_09684 [Periplaneta americana]
MSPGSNTESYPAYTHIGSRENPGKNLNQVTCPDRESNPGYLVSRPDTLTVTPQAYELSPIGKIQRPFRNQHMDFHKNQLFSLWPTESIYHSCFGRFPQGPPVGPRRKEELTTMGNQRVSVENNRESNSGGTPAVVQREIKFESGTEDICSVCTEPCGEKIYMNYSEKLRMEWNFREGHIDPALLSFTIYRANPQARRISKSTLTDYTKCTVTYWRCEMYTEHWTCEISAPLGRPTHELILQRYEKLNLTKILTCGVSALVIEKKK